MFMVELPYGIVGRQSSSNIDRRISLYDFWFGGRLSRLPRWVFGLRFRWAGCTSICFDCVFLFVGFLAPGINIFHGGVYVETSLGAAHAPSLKSQSIQWPWRGSRSANNYPSMRLTKFLFFVQALASGYREGPITCMHVLESNMNCPW